MLIAGVSPSPLPGGWGSSVPVATRLYADHRGQTGYECECLANPRARGIHPAQFKVKSWSARLVLNNDGQVVAVELGKQAIKSVCLNRLLQINGDERWRGEVLGMPLATICAPDS